MLPLHQSGPCRRTQAPGTSPYFATGSGRRATRPFPPPRSHRIPPPAVGHDGTVSNNLPRLRMTGLQRRSQLIDVGRGLFAVRGLDGTTIEEIAACAGVSKPVIYEHFGSKEGLYTEVVDCEFHILLDAVNAAAGPTVSRGALNPWQNRDLCPGLESSGTVRSGVTAAPRPLEPWSIGSNPMGGTAGQGAIMRMAPGAQRPGPQNTAKRQHNQARRART